jgi:hypothetical protein
MASHAKLRAALLRHLFVRSKGNIGQPVPVTDLLADLGLSSAAEGMIVAKQLKAKKLVDIIAHGRDEGQSLLGITIEGIEESERLEMPAIQRWPGEHTVAWPVIVTIFGTLFSIIVGQIITLATRPGPAPAPINQIFIDGKMIKPTEEKAK